MKAIEVKNLVKKYDGQAVINDLSFSVESGSICGFLGPNGAGKTTTLKLLTGLIKNDGGSIKILGHVVTPENRCQEVRYLEDMPNFYDYMNASEYLKFICELNNLDNIDFLVDEALELVDLKKERYKRIGKYSRGMRQRLGIAANVIAKPKVLFLDEPVSALDPIGRKQIFDLIKKLKNEMTILFSTHILDDIERVCDHVIVIDQGIKVIDDNIKDIKKNYLKEAIEIEFSDKNDLNLFLANFKENVLVDGLMVKIMDKDLIITEERIFAVLAKEKIFVDRIAVVTPSLEEVFLKELKR